VAFTGSAQQLALLAAHRRGESDLICRDGMWLLYATVEVADQPLSEPDRFVGVDLGIANIRERVRLRKPQRVTLHSWSFHQLGAFIAYKAVRAGVAVILVNAAYTSQQCSHCGHVDKRNRPGQATFSCTSCGFAEHADVNAARNIASRGEMGWAVSHAA
jgi:transposase